MSRLTNDTPIRRRLAFHPPLAWAQLLAFLAGRGAAGVEAARDGAYIRTVRIGAGAHEARGWLSVRAGAGSASLSVALSPSLRPVETLVLTRLRALLDLDARPEPIAARFALDPHLAPLVKAMPGLRVPGAFDGFELTLRAILGQQVTVKAATTMFGRFAARFGQVIVTPFPALTHLSPDAARVSEAGLQTIIDLGLTRRRAQTVQTVARACADGSLRLEAGADSAAMLAAFGAVHGIGDWTSSYVAMRALRMADAFPHGDLALCRALGRIRPREALVLSDAWRPWRSYAALYLWHGLADGGG